MYIHHNILSSLDISDELRREIEGGLLDNHPGGFSTIRPGMMRKAFDEGAAKKPVDADRAAQLDPDMNRPYRLLQRALEGRTELAPILLQTIGLVALRIRRGERMGFQLEDYSGHEMARAAIDQLKRDIGEQEAFCALRYTGDNEVYLVGVLYHKDGILASAAGISEKAVRAIDVPWLTWKGGQAVWSDPMPHLSADEAARLIFMLERIYPIARFPGMALYLNKYGNQLDAGRRQRFMGQITLCESADVELYAGKGLLEALTVPGTPLPEVFTDTLAVMRFDAGSTEQPDRRIGGRLCSTIRVGDKKTPLLVLPPLSSAILDDPKAVIGSVTLDKAPDRQIAITVSLTYDGEAVERRRTYAIEQLIDLSGAPAIIQLLHMQGVSDAQWNGRCLLVSEAVRPSRFDLEPIFGIPMASFGPIEQCVLPDGRRDVKSHLLHSTGGSWAVYRTGKQTRYVTLTDAAGIPIVHLLTEGTEASWEARRYEGRGLLSIDPGTTTFHMAAILDESRGLSSTVHAVEFGAREISQPIGPMSAATFNALCALCGQTDFRGPLHPTIVEHVRTGDSPADLEAPGIGSRLVNLTAESLMAIGEGAAHTDLSINMKAQAGSGKAENQRATKAYTTALAAAIQLGYLWMLSHGQDKIQMLIAYPKGVKSAKLYDKAVQLVGRSLPQGVQLRHKLMAESAAAGTYIRVTQPEGLPIHTTSDLAVIDIGGSTTDIDVCRQGQPMCSGSFAYAANLFQLSALLALLHKSHEGAHGRWGHGNGMDILSGIFRESRELPKLGRKISQSLESSMQAGKAQARRSIWNEVDRKRLESLFRGGSWMIDPVDSLTQHWLQLWSLPVFELLAGSMKGLEGSAVYSAMVGAGSIYLEGLLQSDSGFRSRIDRWIVEHSGLRAHKMVFTGSHTKPEVAHGMLMAELRGTEGSVPEIEEAAPTFLDPAAVTLEQYRAFVERLKAERLVAPEEEPDDSYGLRSVYDLLEYTPATLDGFDDFASIVSDVAQRFPDVLTGAEPTLLLYLVAFDVAVRNLLNLQLQAR